MTDLGANGGGAPTLAGMSFELAARIDAGTRATRSDMALLRRRFEDLNPAPVWYRAAGSVVAAATGTQVPINLGGPDQGHFWYVRSITVGAQQVGTAGLSGVADAYITAGQLPAAPSLLDWRDRAASLPQKAFYGAGEMPLRLGMKLWVQFTLSAVVAGTTLVAVCQIEDYQEHAGPQEWST